MHGQERVFPGTRSRGGSQEVRRSFKNEILLRRITGGQQIRSSLKKEILLIS
jgi:tRNA threonylcarbamoyladenosine modification (KEOPS) complex Cgi121 subunit